jgi:hypothetical protein
VCRRRTGPDVTTPDRWDLNRSSDPRAWNRAGTTASTATRNRTAHPKRELRPARNRHMCRKYRRHLLCVCGTGVYAPGSRCRPPHARFPWSGRVRGRPRDWTVSRIRRSGHVSSSVRGLSRLEPGHAPWSRVQNREHCSLFQLGAGDQLSRLHTSTIQVAVHLVRPWPCPCLALPCRWSCCGPGTAPGCMSWPSCPAVECSVTHVT